MFTGRSTPSFRCASTIHNQDNAGPLSSVDPRPYSFPSRSVSVKGSDVHPSSILAGCTSRCPYTQTVFFVSASSLARNVPSKIGGSGPSFIALGLDNSSAVPPKFVMRSLHHSIIFSMSGRWLGRSDETLGIATASARRLMYRGTFSSTWAKNLLVKSSSAVMVEARGAVETRDGCPLLFLLVQSTIDRSLRGNEPTHRLLCSFVFIVVRIRVRTAPASVSCNPTTPVFPSDSVYWRLPLSFLGPSAAAATLYCILPIESVFFHTVLFVRHDQNQSEWGNRTAKNVRLVWQIRLRPEAVYRVLFRVVLRRDLPAHPSQGTQEGVQGTGGRAGPTSRR